MAAVRAGYERLAPRYDQWARTVTPDPRAERSSWVADDTGHDGRVLDLGCGTGIPTAVRLSPRTRYIGVDLSPAMIKLASAGVPFGEFWVADMRLLGLPPGSFDAVIAFYSIIHVPAEDQPALFARVFRWLDAGGVFVASLAPEAEEAGTDPDWLGAGPMIWSSLGADRYRSLAVECGFEIVADEVIPQMEGDRPVEFLWLTCRKP